MQYATKISPWLRLMPVGIVFLGACLSGIAFIKAREGDLAIARSVLEQQSTWLARDIEVRLMDSTVPLEAMADFIGTQEEVKAAEFHAFAREARAADPVRTIIWSSLGPDAVREPPKMGAMPMSGAPMLVRFEQRFDGKPERPGFHLGSDPAIAGAIAQALETRQPVATLSPTEEETGLVVVWPVGPGVSPAQIDAEGHGAVLGTLDLPALLEFPATYKGALPSRVTVFIRADRPDAADDPPLALLNPGQPPILSTVPLPGDAMARGMRLETGFEAFGLHWVFVSDFAPSVVSGLRSWTPWVYLALGVLLTLSSAAYVAVEQKRRFAIEAAVLGRTRELMESRRHLLGITSSLFEGVLLVEETGDIQFCNPSADRLLTEDGKSVRGRKLDDVLRLPGPAGFLSFSDSPLRRVMDRGGMVSDDDAIFLIENRRVPVAYACASLNDTGKRRAIVISFRSIESLKEAQREALQASRLASVGQLAAGIAHEINTPVQYVGDNLRFIRDSLGQLTRAARETPALLEAAPSLAEGAASVRALFADCDLDYLMEELPAAADQSLEGVERVTHIVRSMKEFSHPGTTAKAATDINRAIASTITVSTNEWKQVARVETEFAPDLPPVTCMASEINQVILNLIINAAHAVEASPAPRPGLIRVTTRRQGDHVEIRVSDSGTGVPGEIRDRIFDPFFTTKPVGKGTGQGLAIAQDVVMTKHGGRLFLADGPLSGATFVVSLPIDARTGGAP